MDQHVKIASRARRWGGGRYRILTAMRHANPRVVDEQRGVVEYVGRDWQGKVHVVLVRDGDRYPNELVVFHAHPAAIR